jgi:hypothetical protein
MSIRVQSRIERARAIEDARGVDVYVSEIRAKTVIELVAALAYAIEDLAAAQREGNRIALAVPQDTTGAQHGE